MDILFQMLTGGMYGPQVVVIDAQGGKCPVPDMEQGDVSAVNFQELLHGLDAVEKAGGRRAAHQKTLFCDNNFVKIILLRLERLIEGTGGERFRHAKRTASAEQCIQVFRRGPG